MLRPLILIAILPLLASGCGQADAGSDGSDAGGVPQVADVAKNFKHLQAMTPEPVLVDPELAMLCRGASRQDVEAARKRFGPHAHTAVMIYMNDAAAAAFKKSPAAYPVGSIIVKEKRGMDYHLNDASRTPAKTPSGVGGMIKRPAGYDAEHGDWEYFYFEDPAKIESGKIASCVQCHAGAAQTDHVFGGWAKKGG